LHNSVANSRKRIGLAFRLARPLMWHHMHWWLYHRHELRASCVLYHFSVLNWISISCHPACLAILSGKFHFTVFKIKQINHEHKKPCNNTVDAFFG
jgi:hypothetical protein